MIRESPARQHSVSSLGLKSSFSRAVRLLRTHVTRRDYRYRLPWLLAVGEADSGKTTLLSETGLGLPLGRPAEQPHGVKQGVNWFFFDRGVVLDVAGDFVLRPDGEPSNRRGWREIARLLQKYRPERPLDGVVLTIPCTDLVAARGLDGRARIEQKAATLYRKLWQAQKILGMSFPVYVIVTKCDEIAGFRSLCRELPAHARIVINHLTDIIDQFDDLFGRPIPRRGLPSEHIGAGHGGFDLIFDEAQILIDDSHNVEQLPFIFVNTFDLDIAECVGIHADLGRLLDHCGEAGFIGMFDV